MIASSFTSDQSVTIRSTKFERFAAS